VVRFSDDDQVAGMEWINGKLAAWTQGGHRPHLRAALAALGLLGALAALAWLARAALPFLAAGPAGGPGRIPELRPLLRTAGRTAPPQGGETVRAWLARLALLRSDRATPLETLAREADAVAYGGKGHTALARMARAEAKAWRTFS
jgi:hypothetical protein